MPRLKEDSKTLVADLAARLERLVTAARKEGRDEALGQLRALVGGGGAAAVLPRRGPGRPRKHPLPAAAPAPGAKRRKKRKNPWASMSPEQKADRVRKMLAGRGLKPKSDQ